MSLNFSPSLIDILSFSREESVRLGCYYIGLEHLFLGLLREPNFYVKRILAPILPNIQEVKGKIEKLVDSECDKNQNLTDSHKDIPLNHEAEDAIKLSFLEFIKYKSSFIEPEHLLLGILYKKNSNIAKLLKSYNLNYDSAKLIANKILFDNKDKENNPDNEFFSIDELNINNLDDFDDDSDDFDDIDDFDDFDDFDNNDWEERNNIFSGPNHPPSGNSVLGGFGSDLTEEAKSGKLDPIIGRDKEIERIIQILSRRKKNNPIIIGESGVGKTALIEGLATRIVEKKIPHNLYDKKIYSIDITSVIAGTKYRGDFEKRIKNILDELKQNKDIILFIDEIHTIIGAGNAAGSMDASSILKPALAKGEIQCIGTTTYDEYRQFIEKDIALGRRFQRVQVEPTSIQETIEILNKIKDKYQNHHNVIYSDDAIKACVTLSDRYITDRFFPDKAIDVLDETGSKVYINNSQVPTEIIKAETKLLELASKKKDAIKAEKFEEANMIKNEENKINAEIEEIWKKIKLEKQTSPTIVDSNDIAQVISSMTGVPINKISFSETEKLINLEKTLKEKIIGQDYAINKISKAIRRNRTGLKDPEKPIGVFIFLGPTGVGKTYLAKTIAELMFGSADSLIRVDMGEYNEKFSVSRLIGSPPGYVGYEEGGQLTEKVKQKPYSVVLLDEIEKAHNDIFNVLLHTLDYGFMTDGLGRKIDFRNTIIIMTSNIGSREAMEFGGGIGFSIQDQTEIDEKSKTIIEKKLKKTFAPEFINRIDEIITFNSLTKDNIKDILKIEINYLADRMKEINIELKVDDSLLNHIINHEWNLKYGARPVHRALMNYIEDPIADAIISKNPTNKPATIIVKFNKETNKSEVELTVKD